MDKEIAEKYTTHIRWGMGYEYHDAYCPRCNCFICYEPIIRDQKEYYCEKCGQKIKFKD